MDVEVKQISALTNEVNEDKNIMYVMLAEVLTKVTLMGKMLETGEYIVKDNEDVLVLPKETKFYYSETHFRNGSIAIENFRDVSFGENVKVFLRKDPTEFYTKLYKFENGEPKETKVVIKKIIFQNNGSFVPCVDLDGYYTSRMKCLEDNDYEVEEDGIKRFVKSKKKAVALENDQFVMIQELKDLLSKMNDAGIKITVDTMDYRFYFFNTRNLSELKGEWDNAPEGFDNNDFIEATYMNEEHLKIDIENFDCFGYYCKVK